MQFKKDSLFRASVIGAAVASLLFNTGCATIVNGGARQIVVDSQPSGANFVVSKTDTGEQVDSGTTPKTLSLYPKRGYFKGQSYSVKIEQPGFQPATVTIVPKLSAWYFGNIIFGGLIGMLIVDPATGYMWNLTPDKIEQKLNEQQAQILKDGNGFIVVLLPNVTESERAKMVKVGNLTPLGKPVL